MVFIYQSNDSERLAPQSRDDEPNTHVEKTQYLHLYLLPVPSEHPRVGGAIPIAWLLRCHN